MSKLPNHGLVRDVSLRRVLPLAAVFAALVGCSSMDSKRTANEPSTGAPAAAAPALPRASADFSAALRCMDSLLLEHGARDVSVMVEDLVYQTPGAGAGTKELLISVVSDMTQRSRAIRLVASRKDWGNTVNHMAQAQPRDTYAVAPQYALRGTIGMADHTGNLRYPGGSADTAPAAVLGLDLTLLATRDMSVVPGTAARNSILLFRRGAAFDGRAEIRKFGVAFGLASSGGEVVAQASRALAELASIELFGRLTRVPYWTCLGLTDAHAGVAAEIQDWFDAMAAQPAEIIRYFQAQLRLRRAYEGPIDGSVSPQFKEAVAAYREALGLAREPKLSLDFFKAYLGADHRQIEARLAPAAPPAATPAAPLRADTTVVVTAPAAASSPAAIPNAAPVPAAKAGPLGLRVAPVNESRRFAAGEPIQLVIRPSRDAHVYCFLQDEKRRIFRFFPNRFRRDSRVAPGEGLQLPGAQGFVIEMNKRGVPETVSCFAADRDVLAQLPAGVNAGDFDALPVASLEQVRSAFARAANGALAHDTFQIQPK